MRTVFCVVWLAATCAACKEEMHPPPESENVADKPAQPEVKPQPQPEAKAKPPAETAPQADGKAPPPSAAPVELETSSTITDPVTGAKKEVTNDGYEVIRANPHDGKGQGANIEVKAPPGWKVTQPPDSPDPHGGKFTLPEALKGLPAKGKLVATIHTSLGAFQCDLFDDKAPKTVANFVGLARGVRKFWSAKDRAWVARPYYDGTTFHRVIPEFMIQGGDWAGDGSGGMYFTIPDEVDPSLKHDRGGLLCMANRGPNTNEAQFFITEAAAPHLDSSYTIFGECSPLELVKRIARVPQSGPPNNRPLTPVVIEHVTVERRAKAVMGDANASKSAAPAAPVGRAVEVPAH